MKMLALRLLAAIAFPFAAAAFVVLLAALYVGGLVTLTGLGLTWLVTGRWHGTEEGAAAVFDVVISPLTSTFKIAKAGTRP